MGGVLNTKKISKTRGATTMGNEAPLIATHARLNRLRENLRDMCELYQAEPIKLRTLMARTAVAAVSGRLSRIDFLLDRINRQVELSMESLVVFMIEHAVEIVRSAIQHAFDVALAVGDLDGLAARPDLQELAQKSLDRVFRVELREWMVRASEAHKQRARKLTWEDAKVMLCDVRNYSRKAKFSLKKVVKSQEKFVHLCSMSSIDDEEAKFLHSYVVHLHRAEFLSKFRSAFEAIVEDTISQFGIAGQTSDTNLSLFLFKNLTIDMLGIDAIERAIIDAANDENSILTQTATESVNRMAALRDDGSARSFVVHQLVGKRRRMAMAPYLAPPLFVSSREASNNGFQGIVPTWDVKTVFFTGKWYFAPFVDETELLCLRLLRTTLQQKDNVRRNGIERLARIRTNATILADFVLAATEPASRTLLAMGPSFVNTRAVSQNTFASIDEIVSFYL